MSFAWPWALVGLGLIPVLLLGAWMLRRRRRRGAIRVSSVALIRSAAPAGARWYRRIPAALLVLALAVLAVGAARPQATVPVPSNGTTIILALDVSGSMCSTDVDPNRLVVAQKAASDFVQSQKGNARIGLVAFSGVAGLLVPPTEDTQKLLDAIQKLSTSRGTAIGTAILTSIDAIAEVDPSVSPTGVEILPSVTPAGYASDAIVVLTDGASTQGVNPVDAANAAAARGIRVYTIGFGTTTPSPMVCSSSQIAGGNPFSGLLGGGFAGGLGSSQTGRNPLEIDEQALTQVADATGGTYYRAASAGDLNDAMRQLPSSLTLVHKEIDLSAWFALAGGTLVALAVAASLWWSRVRRPARVAAAPPAKA